MHFFTFLLTLIFSFLTFYLEAEAAANRGKDHRLGDHATKGGQHYNLTSSSGQNDSYGENVNPAIAY
jgi:hypothetical protein